MIKREDLFIHEEIQQIKANDGAFIGTCKLTYQIRNISMSRT